MNNDFEKKLQDQPLRRAPAEWRGEILRAAKPVARRETDETVAPFWQLIFGRYPVASAAFAGFWMVLIAVNLMLFSGTGSSSHGRSIARSNEPSSIWRLQSEELQQIASGDVHFAPEQSAPAPTKLPSSPRSDLRKEDEGVGEGCPGESLNSIA